MKIITDNLHRQFTAHLRERAVDAGAQPDAFHAAMLRAKIHNLAQHNPRAAHVMFKMLPGQSSPAGLARLRAMIPNL